MDKILTTGINEVFDKDSIKNAIEDFKNKDLDDTRFILLLEIRKDGALYFVNVGRVSGLELSGLPQAVDDICNQIVDEIEDE